MAWDLSRRDWEERLRAGESLLPELPLDRRRAERAVAVYNRLKLPDVPGTPALGEAGGEWFREYLGAMFGAFDDGVRMVREGFILVPKKNSKTTNGAALMLTALLLNERPRAEFLLIGPTQSIADLAFGQAVGMVEADDDLRKRLHVQDHLKRITVKRPGTGAQLKVKTFDTKILTGAKPTGVLVDELHELASDASADRVIGQIRGGLIPNPEGFLVFITTQSEKPPAGVFRAELMKARAIRDGRRPGAMLPLLYEFPEAMLRSGAWEDRAHWPLVTPNRGRSITIDRLVADYADALATGEAERRRWASQHLNVEIGLALASDAWRGAEVWEAAGSPALTLERLLDRSEVAVVGIDGGGLDDLLAIAVMGRDRETRQWLLWVHAWAHPKVLERRKGEASRLTDFADDGDLTLVEQLGDDLEGLADIVETVAEAGLLPAKNAIGVDPMGIGEVVDAIVARGVPAESIVGIAQGWKLNGAIKTTERKLADGTLVHGGRPIAAWAAGNAKVEPRGNAVTITKQTAGAAKIDPLVAAFNAVALMSMNPGSALAYSDGRDLVTI